MTSLLAWRRASLLAVLVASLVTEARVAGAEESKKAQCASAYEKSQELRAAGSLKSAHDMLVVCAQDFCPAFVQSDCAQWLTEVSRDLPTVVVVAKDRAGEDTTAVAVTMDGVELMKQLDGKAVTIDPGPHTFRFEFAGADPIEQQIVVRQGQKDRVIAVSFARVTSDATGASPYATAAKGEGADAAADTKHPGPLRPYAYIAGGVGAASLITFAVLGGIGKGQESDLRGSCAPNCSRSDTDAIKTKYVVADVFLGLGIAGIGTGVALFFLSQPKKEPPAHAIGKLRFDVGAVPGAAFATMAGKF